MQDEGDGTPGLAHLKGSDRARPQAGNCLCAVRLGVLLADSRRQAGPARESCGARRWRGRGCSQGPRLQ